jgi:predicted nucleic acid-binding protein
LDLLQKLYKQVYIPSAVYKEIEFGKAKGYYKDLTSVDWRLQVFHWAVTMFTI